MEAEEPKQWIILRKDLKMRKGKMIAQGAHASMSVIFGMFDKWMSEYPGEMDKENEISYRLYEDEGSAVQKWIDGAFTKIALSVDSEEELIALYDQAKERGLPCSLIEDKGLTEFHGVLTKTAIAIGPAYPSQVSDLLGELKLL